MTKDEHIEVLMNSMHLMSKEIARLKEEITEVEKEREDQHRWREKDKDEFKDSNSHLIKLLLEASIPPPRTVVAAQECLKRLNIRQRGITWEGSNILIDLTDYKKIFIEEGN